MSAVGRWPWRGANSRNTTRAPGWVEHDADAIWRDTLATMREAIDRSGLGAQGIAAIGITNQRETSVLWDRTSGEPIHRAIVWQDRRTAPAVRPAAQ